MCVTKISTVEMPEKLPDDAPVWKKKRTIDKLVKASYALRSALISGAYVGDVPPRCFPEMVSVDVVLEEHKITTYETMKYYAGGELFDRMANNAEEVLAAAGDYIRQILSALRAMEEMKLPWCRYAQCWFSRRIRDFG